MNRRSTVVACVLGFVLANSLCAGIYQHTTDGRAKVWNDNPELGDAATWSGATDAKGYATGYGTITWLKTRSQLVTGTNIPLGRRPTVSRQYTGTMVRGKLQPGGSPTPTPPITRKESAAVAAAPKEPTAPASTRGQNEIAAITPTPTPAERSKKPSNFEKQSAAEPDRPSHASPSPAADAVNALTRPPSSLHLNSEPSPTPSTSPTPE